MLFYKNFHNSFSIYFEEELIDRVGDESEEIKIQLKYHPRHEFIFTNYALNGSVSRTDTSIRDTYFVNVTSSWSYFEKHNEFISHHFENQMRKIADYLKLEPIAMKLIMEVIHKLPETNPYVQRLILIMAQIYKTGMDTPVKHLIGSYNTETAKKLVKVANSSILDLDIEWDLSQYL